MSVPDWVSTVASAAREIPKSMTGLVVRQQSVRGLEVPVHQARRVDRRKAPRQPSEQAAGIPGCGYLMREARTEPGLPGQLRPDHLCRHQSATPGAAKEHLPHP